MQNRINGSPNNQRNEAEGFKCCGRLQPNKSLKLTELAVDDFAARQYAGNDMISGYVRATNYMELAARRRSLAPVR